MFKHDKYILRVYFHNGEMLETEATVEEVNKIYKIFTENKEDIFSSGICIVGDNEIDIYTIKRSEVYKILSMSNKNLSVFLDGCICREIKVIGNIYEDKDLLED